MNNFSYTVFGSDKFSDRDALGFTGGNFSTDGSLVVGDLGSAVECVGCDNALAKPSYVPATFKDSKGITRNLADNWPHLDHDEAGFIIKIKASSVGASDGWSFF